MIKPPAIIFSIMLLVFVQEIPALDNPTIDTSSVELVDENGATVTIRDFAGYTLLVFFGFTHCPDICPLTLYHVATALKSIDSGTAGRIRVLFISIDPKRDSPQVLAAYTDAFHPDIIGLTGSDEQLAVAAKQFRTSYGYSLEENGRQVNLGKEEYREAGSDADYVPYHSSQLYLLDKDGGLADIIGYGSDSTAIADKLLSQLNRTPSQ